MTDLQLLGTVRQYVEQNIGKFHQTRLDSLRGLKLKQILKHKNPYLFRAKDLVAAPDLIKSLLDAYLSSQEETMFGEFLEGVAIFVCERVYGGQKSTRPSLDLEFIKDGTLYIVSIKSGPNWGNADQIRKMRENFAEATTALQSLNPQVKITAINGCCYGQDANPDKGDYFKFCGQDFWEFISGVATLYTEIIEPLGHQAKEKNDAFAEEYGALITTFTVEFAGEFCEAGKIDWAKLVAFNSAHVEPRAIKEKRRSYKTRLI